MLNLLSWNVNGIRAVEKKGFLEWLEKTAPDILCLQETKAEPGQLSQNLLAPKGYKTFWSSAEKKGYSGVGVFTKKEPLKVEVGLGIKEFDSEGRTLILDYDKFILLNVYFPNGGAGNKRVPFKMKFYEAFLKKINSLKAKGKRIIICGDVNTAHEEIDLARPKENVKNTGFLPEERAWVSKLIQGGYVDTFRHLNKEKGHYTWWDYKTGARARDIGWRIDYFFISENLLSFLRNADIIKEVMGSDHCPISLNIDIKL
ncbi:MAG: exodeoxyribonuclease III [Candidatus Omnitrophica bacterium]|nr:exodeoxyribonuclease III [Candidatus Omnitrophota bacterium]